MALPLIAAGIAARVVAKKLATRVVGGITGAGAKTVAPINRNMGTGNVKVINIKQNAKELSKYTVNNISASQYKNIINKGNTEITNSVKSGQNAKESAALRELQNLSRPKKTIKIKSNK